MSGYNDRSTILVPIQIEALVVDQRSAKDNTWKDMSVNYEGISDLLGSKMDDDVVMRKKKKIRKNKSY